MLVIMKDWKAIAKAGGFAIPPADMDRIVDPLSTLETAFRPLVKDLPVDLEPATVYRAEDGE